MRLIPKTSKDDDDEDEDEEEESDDDDDDDDEEEEEEEWDDDDADGDDMLRRRLPTPTSERWFFIKQVKIKIGSVWETYPLHRQVLCSLQCDP